MKYGNRGARTVLAAATALMLATACGAPETAVEGDAAGGEDSSDVLKLGVLAPQTGNLGALGEDMVNGWELFWEENGTEFGGTTVEYQVEDTTGDPAVALTKTGRLVDDYGAEAVVGPIAANVALAVADDLKRRGVASIQASTAADDLTQRLFDPLIARPGGSTSSQSQHAAGKYAFDQGYRTAVTICPDYAFGHENCGGFSRTFTDAGGEVVERLWYPLGTQDFSTYITQIQNADPDVVYVAGTGGDAPSFLSAWSDFGLKGKIPFIGNSTILEQSVIRNLGDEALGLLSFGYYAEGRQEPATQEFVAAYEEAYGEIPSVYAASAYAAAEWIARALEVTNGDIGEGEEIINAIEEVGKLDTPLGPMNLDEYNNPVQNVYLREVQRRADGVLWNVPIETFEEVSQFYTFDPEEFLENPVYSRDFQG